MSEDERDLKNSMMVFGDDGASLSVFMAGMAKFDRRFCDAMATGVDFTLRLELSGNKGKLNHCRVYDDEFDRPPGVERDITAAKRKK